MEGTFNPKTIVNDKKLYVAMLVDPMLESSVPDALDTSRCLRELKSVPVLFLHNANDPLAPYESGRRLYDSYQGPKEFSRLKPRPAQTRITALCPIQTPGQGCWRS